MHSRWDFGSPRDEVNPTTLYIQSSPAMTESEGCESIGCFEISLSIVLLFNKLFKKTIQKMISGKKKTECIE